MENASDYLSNKLTLLKVMSTILIVFLHAEPAQRYGLENDLSHPYIYLVWVFTQIAVPIFFFISGFLFYRNCEWENLGRKLKSRIHTLVIPFILWNLLFVTFYFTLSHVSFIQSRMNNDFVENSIYDFFLAIITSRYTDLWFVSDLILMSLLSPVLLYVLKRPRIAVFCMVTSMAMLCMFDFGYNSLFRWFPIYFMGCLCGRYLEYDTSNTRHGVIYPLAIQGCRIKKTLSTILTVLLSSSYVIAVFKPQYVTIFRILGPICVWFLLDIFAVNTVKDGFKVRKWMSYTFVIYCIHHFILNIIEKIVVLSLPPKGGVLALTFFISPIVTLFISILICRLFSGTVAFKVLSGGRIRH